MPTSSWIVYLEKIIKVMTISIIWIPKYRLDTQIIFILKIENQLDAVTDWKVHSAGNKGVFREVEEFRFREKGKNQNYYLLCSLLCQSVLHIKIWYLTKCFKMQS